MLHAHAYTLFARTSDGRTASQETRVSPQEMRLAVHDVRGEVQRITLEAMGRFLEREGATAVHYDSRWWDIYEREREDGSTVYDRVPAMY
jgi:hypothetical protein